MTVKELEDAMEDENGIGEALLIEAGAPEE